MLCETWPAYNDQSIKSGQVLSKIPSGGTYYFQRGLATKAGVGATGATVALPFLAILDDTDPDVVAAGGIWAVAFSENFSVETPWFVTGTEANWDAGAEISAYSAADGTDANRGKIKLAASGEIIIGVLTGDHKDGLVNRADAHPEVTAVAGAVNVACFASSWSPGQLAA